MSALSIKAFHVSSITLALSKGRIFEETLPLLAAAGIVPTDNPESSRKLIIGTNRPDVRLVIVRATDTPTYVQYGAADLGIAGKDVLIEHGGAGLYQPLDLNIAKCRLCVAVQRQADASVDLVSTGGTLRANNLDEVEDIMPISSRLIVNQASLKLKRELLQPVLDAFAGAIKP